MDVSIIMPLHNPDNKILKNIDSMLKKQKTKSKVQIIKVNKNLGLADSMNYGIKKARYPIVITLHQDCVPESDNWLANLIAPLEENEVVASVSKVHLPQDLWNSFDYLAKIMSVKEQKIITPLLDEKGCAYKKSILKKVGLFDGKNFKTAGEDFDMYIKLTKIGKIAYPNVKVMHYHNYNWRTRLKKEFQLSNAFGALFRIYGKNLPGWYRGVIKSIPVIGWPTFWLNFPYVRMPLGGIIWIFLSFLVNLIYSFSFWKGFLIGRQTT